jgi:hypothetical protein
MSVLGSVSSIVYPIHSFSFQATGVGTLLPLAPVVLPELVVHGRRKVNRFPKQKWTACTAIGKQRYDDVDSPRLRAASRPGIFSGGLGELLHCSKIFFLIKL